MTWSPSAFCRVFQRTACGCQDDIAIVGYDDIEFAAAAAVPLSSVRQPRDELGRRGAELLYEELGALKSGRPVEHQHIRFQPTLIVRLSSA